MIKSDLIQRISSQSPDLYQRDIEKIINAILDVTEAAEIMRSLIDRIVLTPEGDVLRAELHGDLAVLARFAQGKEGRAESPGDSALRLSVVAAVGFENFRPGRAAMPLAGPLASFKSTSCKIQKGVPNAGPL